MWEDHRVEMEAALERHDEILRSAIKSHGGYVFSTAGDAFAASFGRVEDAISAATEAQTGLGGERWPEQTPIRVRMGLHTGEAQERGGDYFGPAVNRAARIMSAGHGGQVLVSAATSSMVQGVDLRDLGEHRLKDLGAPERISQLVIAGVDRSFPPLQSLSSVRHNLPVQRTVLVGRDDDVAEVVELGAGHRLVTLTGVGGAGKTRLALAAAAEMVDRFDDGVFFVPLAAVDDPGLVAPAVAEAAGVTLGDLTPEGVAGFLGSRRVLVVLDNCEHLIDEVAELVDMILEAGDAARVLATSREALEVDGEQTLTVRSLAGGSPDSPAVRLLLDRARAVRPDLVLDDESMTAAVEICTRLDGIPLALELAAAQFAHLSPADLAQRLDDRFRLLVGGRRRRLQRQHTLQAVMDWSWDLLQGDEQRLLAQLSVFSGGWTLDAAEGVCQVDSSRPIAALLRSLVSKSLVSIQGAADSRYTMLETVRLYSQQKLLDRGETSAARERHARFFCDLAARTDIADRWLDIGQAARWQRETSNIQAAVDWLRDQDRLSEAATLVTMPALMWRGRGAAGQITHLVTDILASPLSDLQRAVALVTASELAWGRGDIAAMGHYAHEAAALGRQLANQSLTAVALILEGITLQGRDPDQAEEVLTEAAHCGASAGQPRLEAAAWAMAAGFESMGRGRIDEARKLVQRALPNVDPEGFEAGIADASIAALEIVDGNFHAAEAAVQSTHQRFTNFGVRQTWDKVLDEAVFAGELSRPFPQPMTRVVDELTAAGGNIERVDLVTLPLGVACRNRDWPQAARIIASTRAFARTGRSFSSPLTTAYYLHYLSQVPTDDLDAAQPLPIADIVQAEIQREAQAS